MTAPDHLLGQTGQRAVHTFVEPPALDDGDPEAVQLVDHHPGGFYSARQPTRVHYVELGDRGDEG